MLTWVIKKIPFAISTFTAINILIIKLSEKWEITLLKEYKKILFNPRTLIYFNYWIVYNIFAIIISILYAITKKTSSIEMIIAIMVNLVSCIAVYAFAMCRM